MAEINLDGSKTDETTTGASDGTITLMSAVIPPPASGTFYNFSINNAGIVTSASTLSDTYTFTGLSSGVYQCFCSIDSDLSRGLLIPIATASPTPDPDPPIPPVPIVYEYFGIYQGDFCDKRGNTIFVNFSQRKPEGSLPTIPIHIQFAGENDSPVTIEYVDNGEYKLEPINGSQCEIRIKAIGDFELSSMYTADEKEWKVDITGAWTWSGFLIPDSCIEPFASKPYDVSVRATDALGLLKDVPFQSDNLVKIKGYYSDKEVVRVCLAKTGLDLKMNVAVNTYEALMTVDSTKSPMGQSYIDTEPFLNDDGTAKGCYEVLESVLRRWSCRLHQFNGRWQIVNAMEKSLGSVKTYQFNTLGFPEGSPFQLGNAITVGGQNRFIRPVGDTSFAKAFKQSETYYKYGYLSNILPNGNFDIWTSKPVGLPDNWVAVGDVVASTGIRYQDGLPTSDNFLIVGGSGSGRVENTQSIQILKGDFPTISFDFKANDAWGNNVSDTNGRYLSVLIQSSTGRYFTADGWKMTFGYYVIKYLPTEFNKDLQVQINVTALDEDYLMKVGVLALGLANGVHFNTSFNNFNLNAGVGSGAVKNPIGESNIQVQLSKQTFIPDRIELMHSDDANKLRTSGIRINSTSDGQLFDPTSAPFSSLWKRAGINENAPLLRIISNSELRLHQRPYRIIEFEYVSDFASPSYVPIDINTLLTVDLLEGTFIFISGSFDLKTGIPRLKFGQVLTDEVIVNETLKMDYGD